MEEISETPNSMKLIEEPAQPMQLSAIDRHITDREPIERADRNFARLSDGKHPVIGDRAEAASRFFLRRLCIHENRLSPKNGPTFVLASVT